MMNGSTLKTHSENPPNSLPKGAKSRLSCLDAKIELNNEINENLEAQAQVVFKNWFVDFEPFQDGEFVESELGLIPEGWHVSALSDAIDVNPVRILKKGSLATHLGMANVPTSGSRALSWKQREFTSGTRFTNGDVLVARITPCLENGKTAFVDFLSDGEIGWGSTEFIVMRSREPLVSNYVRNFHRVSKWFKPPGGSPEFVQG
jgi:type I restriction enzyme S subunit